MPVEMSREDFEALVEDALDEIPDEFWDQVENLVVLVEDDPPEDDPDLLGLYDGVPVTARDDYAGVLPDRVFLYRNPTLRICATREEVAEQVRITAVHEIGHYFGVEDAELDELGWG